jgi:hypothetical protein
LDSAHEISSSPKIPDDGRLQFVGFIYNKNAFNVLKHSGLHEDFSKTNSGKRHDGIDYGSYPVDSSNAQGVPFSGSHAYIIMKPFEVNGLNKHNRKEGI